MNITRNQILTIALALTLLAIGLYTLTPTPTDTPTNNTSPPNKYPTADELSLTNSIQTTLNANTIYYNQYNNSTPTHNYNRTKETTLPTTTYHYTNNTTNETAYAQYTAEETAYRYLNNTVYLRIEHEKLDDGTVSTFQYQTDRQNTNYSLNTRTRIHKNLTTILQNKTITEIKTVNNQTTPTEITYSFKGTGSITITENKRITQIHTEHFNITIKYATPLPERPPKPESDTESNSTPTNNSSSLELPN